MYYPTNHIRSPNTHPSQPSVCTHGKCRLSGSVVSSVNVDPVSRPSKTYTIFCEVCMIGGYNQQFYVWKYHEINII